MMCTNLVHVAQDERRSHHDDDPPPVGDAALIVRRRLQRASAVELRVLILRGAVAQAYDALPEAQTKVGSAEP